MRYSSLWTDPELGGGNFVIRRRSWIREDGVPVPVDTEEIFASGVLHPASPDALSLFPEEFRHEPLFLVHSTEPLSLGENAGDAWTGPDEILYRGGVYRVIQLRNWQSCGFWKAWAVRLDKREEDAPCGI